MTHQDDATGNGERSQSIHVQGNVGGSVNMGDHNTTVVQGAVDASPDEGGSWSVATKAGVIGTVATVIGLLVTVFKLLPCS